MRAAAYQEQFRVYAEDAPILSQLYQYRMRDWRSENLRLRGFASPIAVRKLSNNIPDEVVDTLLEVCRKNAGVFQRYFELKARTVGMDRLRRYDIYAPVAGTEKTYAYGEAVDLVLDSFQRFEPRVAELARKVFAEHHVDSEIRHGKRSGAFCATVSPDYTPWLHQTFNGKPRDVATLAHELGHAVHSLLANAHSLLTQHAALPLAETASTFGEMVLVDRLLELDPAPDVQRTLLFQQMDDNYATIQRQAYFAMFEKQAAEIIEAGGTEEDLSRAYLANLRDQFGEAVDVSDNFRHEWIVVPHFQLYPFYVYAYTFGQLLVLSLYRQYRAEGESFKPRYLQILSAGGSDSPERILQHAGIDMRSAAFWQGGFDVVEASLAKLKALEPAR
jgi:oligoendopeptidase F